MREKIEHFAEGKFHYSRPTLTITDQSIIRSVQPGQILTGEFAISTSDKSAIKGVVYTSTARMSVDHTAFFARTMRFVYHFDATGMYGSEIERGNITLVTEAGEFQIPYEITAVLTSGGEDYSYFITADPIDPLPESLKKKNFRKPEVVVVRDDTKDLLTKEEAERLAVLVLKSKSLSPVQLGRLIRAYEAYKSKEILTGICGALIKDDRTDDEAFSWYKEGVEQEVKITNLYEYYMHCLPEDYDQPIPKNALLYFMYNNTLSARQKILLYANITRYEEKEGVIFREYKRQIEPFVLDQLLQRKISDHLAFLYREFLVDSLLSIDFAEALADVMFLSKITCDDPRIRQVRVIQESLGTPITVNMKGGTAFVPVFSNKARILMVDASGNAYANSVPFVREPVLDPDRYTEACRKLLKFHTGLYLYLYEHTPYRKDMTAEELQIYLSILQNGDFSETFRQEIRREVLEYYQEHLSVEPDIKLLAAQSEQMLPADRAKYTELLISRGDYQDAWKVMSRYGFGLVRAGKLALLISWRLHEKEYGSDPELIRMCLRVFEDRKYSDEILQYLAEYYVGDIATMTEIWKAGRIFEVNTYDLEERMLSQMLFTENISPNAFEVFEEFEKSGEKSLLSTAFLSYFSYLDFVKNEPVPDALYRYLEHELNWESALSDVCRLSLLRYLTKKENLSKMQTELSKKLLKDLLYRNISFGFMKDLSVRLDRAYMLEDKWFAEYHTDPESRVVIHYVLETPGSRTSSYMTEHLYPAACGIFIKDFTLFYGDTLTYFFTETTSLGEEKTSKTEVIRGDLDRTLDTGSKFASIYEMSRALENRDEEALLSGMRQYEEKQYLVDRLFHIK